MLEKNNITNKQSSYNQFLIEINCSALGLDDYKKLS